jgi:hypothetical protein
MEYWLQMHMNARCNHVSEKPEDLIRQAGGSYRKLPRLLRNMRFIIPSYVKQNSTESMGRELFVLVATKALCLHR